MKFNLIALATTFATFIALSPANAEPEKLASRPTAYLVQVDGTPVAILPADMSRTISVCCSGDASYDKNTGVVRYTHNVKLVSSVADHDSVTITGENMTLLPQH